jgi:glycosyltransferase involved in cell wall biosynthesis
MAKVLMLSYLPVSPANSGGRVRIYQLARHLAERHDVTLLCPPPERPFDQPPPFEVVSSLPRGARQLADPRAYRAVLDAARALRPDYILLEYVWQGLHAQLARLAARAPLLLDAFDVVTERLRSARDPRWPLAGAYERLVLRSAARVFAVSEDDRARLVRLGAAAARTDIVPNGVDTSQFKPDSERGRRTRERLGLSERERALLYFGQLDYAPNARAVRTLARDFLPRLDDRYRLFIAGPGGDRLRSELGNGRIAFLGPVDPLPDYINAAGAVVAPVEAGSGTRIKLLESVACGTPTVATSIAAEGLDRAACGPDLDVVDGWDAFARAAAAACERPRAGPPDAFRALYDWRAIVRRMPL